MGIMAEFNSNIFDEKYKNNKEEQLKCVIYFQECLSKEEYIKLKNKWKEINEINTIPWWKFVFENIEVKLKEDF